MLSLLVLLLPCIVVASRPVPLATVSIFRENADDLKTYAAVLAASEPLRRHRDEVVGKAVSPLTKIYIKLKGLTLGEYAEKLRSKNSQVDEACYSFESITEDVIRSYGLTASSFNDIAKYVNDRPALRQKVILQAYYFRLAAELKSALSPLSNLHSAHKAEARPSVKHVAAVGAPRESKVKTKSTASPSSSSSSSPLPASTFERFCLALRTLEQERLHFRRDLQSRLGCEALPDKMCEPSYYPAMNKEVQKACEGFPRIASDICRDLNVEESLFAEYSERMRTDPLLRLKVSRTLASLDKRDNM